MEGGAPRSLVDRGYLAGLVVVLALEAAGVAVQIETGRAVPVITVAACALVLACVLRIHGVRGTMAFIALVIAIPFGSEFVGVLTGVPYGPYVYTGALGPWLFGLVPVFILIAWINITYLVLFSTTLALGRSRLWLALLDGALAASWDAMVDPLAVRAGYWAWLSPGGLYGVPLTNFLGWFAVVSLFSFAIRLLWSRGVAVPRPTTRVTALLVPVLLLASAASFAALSLTSGFPLSALIGLAVPVPIVAAAGIRLFRTPPGELFAGFRLPERTLGRRPTEERERA